MKKTETEKAIRLVAILVLVDSVLQYGKLAIEVIEKLESQSLF